ncbi:hypothetical protein D6764_05265 [Candidatus Woesearchaeota archaeon]|nr:MAG: hypothetical protein D6764_05265 [Candidatus Woesearchaeota archaeon]
MADDSPQETEQQQQPDLGDLVQQPSNERWEVKARRLINHALFGGLSTAFTYATLGPAALATPTAFALFGAAGKIVKGEKPLYDVVDEAITTYGAVNTVLFPMVQLGNVVFPAISSPLLKGLTAIGPYNATFVSSFLPTEYLIRNDFNPEGMGEHLKKEFWPVTKRFAWVFAPGYIFSANGLEAVKLPFEVPPFGDTLPTFSLNAPFAGFLGGYSPPKSKEEQQQPPQEQSSFAPYLPENAYQMQAPVRQYRNVA